MNSKNLIPISECLALWAKESSIEINDFKFPKKKKRKVKIGRTDKGDLISVAFKYLKNDEIEIYSARRIK